jgi:F-type H+-transporting ATPase subunit gamma
MESLQSIKRRQKGVKNINQITKAMELVSATKMRKSQEIALASRPYALTALDILATLTRIKTGATSPLFETREVAHTLFVVIASDKGLAGSFNNEVIRSFEKYLKTENISYDDSRFLFAVVGEKAKEYIGRRAPLVESFTHYGDFTTIDEVRPLADFMMQGFLEKRWDRVLVFSTHFESALKQKALAREILPVTFDGLEKTAKEIIPAHGRFAELVETKEIPFFNEKIEENDEYLIEPSPERVLAELVPYLVTMQVYHLMLETNASEHAARRVAMKNASDNAEEIAGELDLAYNKSRQASITRELIEITAGAEGLTT